MISPTQILLSKPFVMPTTLRIAVLLYRKGLLYNARFKRGLKIKKMTAFDQLKLPVDLFLSRKVKPKKSQIIILHFPI